MRYNPILGDDSYIQKCINEGKVTWKNEDKNIFCKDKEFRSGHVVIYYNYSDLAFSEIMNCVQYRKDKFKRGDS